MTAKRPHAMLRGMSAIEKAEGSRGGHVIGHTSSGKPIYAHESASEHAQSSANIGVKAQGATGAAKKAAHAEQAELHERAAALYTHEGKHAEATRQTQTAAIHRQRAGLQKSLALPAYVIPGQVPRQTQPAALEALTGMPKPVDMAAARLAFTDPVLRVEGITKGLPMEATVAKAFEKFITSQLQKASNEAEFRQGLFRHLHYDMKEGDPTLRRALVQRSLAFYKSKGTSPKQQIVDKRVQGFRMEKAEAPQLYIGPMGGKYLDAAHKHAWHEGQPKPRPVKALGKGDEMPKLKRSEALAGNLGIDRLNMPQIPAKALPAFLDEMKTAGVKVTPRIVPASALRATQNELHRADVEKNLTEQGQLEKPIVVSSDGFVLDGHHRWAAIRALDPQGATHTVEVGLPIRELLKRAHDFSGVEYKKSQDEADMQFVIKSEGSRGGKVIGHTSSGKPVYENANHPAHASFTKDDHSDAIDAHNTARDKHARSGDKAAAAHANDQAMEHYHAKKRTPTTTPAAPLSTAGSSGPGFHAPPPQDRRPDPVAAAQRAGMSLLTKSEGARGGHVIGHTGSGKPIYAGGPTHPKHSGFTTDDHHDATKANFAAMWAAKDKGDAGTAAKHMADAEMHGLTGQSMGRSPTTSFSTYDAHLVLKAEARGGSYHRRVTDPESGKHRYFYKEEDYAKRPDAHVSGAEAKKARAKRHLMEHVGEDGASVDSLRKLTDRYDSGMITDLVKECVDCGDLEHSGGLLRKKKAPTVDTVEKAEGMHGGHVIGHTSSGKPVYENKHPSHKSFTSKEHLEAAKLHHTMASHYSSSADEANDHLSWMNHHTRMGDRFENAAKMSKGGDRPWELDRMEKGLRGWLEGVDGWSSGIEEMLLKAVGHKYVSRTPKRGGKGWDYVYADGQEPKRRGYTGQETANPYRAVEGKNVFDNKPAANRATPEVKREKKRVWVEHHPDHLTRDEGGTAAKYGINNETGVPSDPARAKLHEDIIAKHFDHVPSVPRDQKPVAFVTMGGPASGKTSALKGLGIAQRNDFVHVDPDGIKTGEAHLGTKGLPEFHEAASMGYLADGSHVSAKSGAAVVHEESSYVAQRLRDKAIDARKNVVIDGTGKNADSHIKMIQRLKEQGYHVHLVMPHQTKENAKKLNSDRSEKQGRFVPEDIVDDAYAKIPHNFHRVAAHADQATLFNARDGFPPVKVWSKHTDGTTTTHDKAFMADFNEKHGGPTMQKSENNMKPIKKDLPLSIPQEKLDKMLDDAFAGATSDPHEAESEHSYDDRHLEIGAKKPTKKETK